MLGVEGSLMVMEGEGLKAGGRVAIGKAGNRILGRKKGDGMTERGREEKVSKWVMGGG